MTHIVTEVTAYDKKRWKVTLDEGAVAFLLYRGETEQAGITVSRDTEPLGSGYRLFNGRGERMLLPGASGKEEIPEGAEGELSEEAWCRIKEEILLPRAKKCALYYLKNGDKTEYQLREKLRAALYPGEIIDAVLEFLKHYRLADDERYAENYVNQLKGRKSKREIEAKLYAKGMKKEAVQEALSELPQEDEYGAAVKALRRRYTGDRKKDYAALARRGFSRDAIEHAFQSCGSGLREEEESGF